ncbi:4Fe-4S binding protein [bacterium]|nr:4Fe-4S binding protein [bacterium]
MTVSLLISINVILIFACLMIFWATQKLEIYVSKRLKEVDYFLPQTDCGDCSYKTCLDYAKAILDKNEKKTLCKPGGKDLILKFSQYFNEKIEAPIKKVAFIRCSGGEGLVKEKFDYEGLESCAAANLMQGGNKACDFACLVFGDCIKSCDYNAIVKGENGLPFVIDERCTSCEDCVEVCPKGIIDLIPESVKVDLACSAQIHGEEILEACKKSCTSCGICVEVCPYEAVELNRDFLVSFNELCTNCGICVPKCPTGVISDKIPFRSKVLINTNCTNCGDCVPVCPEKCILEVKDDIFKVEQNFCIGCGVCLEKCKDNAISTIGALAYTEDLIY